MKVDILTLFPAMFSGPFDESIIGRACQRGLLEICIHNIRDHALDKHQQVDDYPYGGGAGMVLKADVVCRAIDTVTGPDAHVIYLSPQGPNLVQATAARLAVKTHLILLCGHYEGIDERVMELVDEEISIGDFILSGGELAAMVVVNAVTRLISGVLGDENSAREESFAGGLLEYPHYTRPRVFRDAGVPEVLLSGHHEHIRRWRKRLSLERTLLKRPDLLLGRNFDPEERQMLEEILFGGENGVK